MSSNSPSFLGAGLAVPAGAEGSEAPSRDDLDTQVALCAKIAGLTVDEGDDAKMGVATLVAGEAVVANESVAADSRILLTSQVDGGTPGFLRVSTRVAGTSFTITSSSNTDTSTVAYVIIDPAA